MKKFIELPKVQAGDQVAIVSPSAGLPGLFPWVQELGLQRIKEVFHLTPIEYPTTRQMGSSLQDRAKDLMAAFTDPRNKAVISSIGGDDQIKLLKLLDPEVFTANPKPFFGYSDNTHFINYLWNLGIPAYYGGAVMTQFAMQTAMHDYTVRYLQSALFATGETELAASDAYTDEGLDWADKANLSKSRRIESNDGWYWDGSVSAEGILWGGCVESMVAQFSVGKYVPKDEDLEGAILYLETAEDIPEVWLVEYVLTGMGERGWFDRFRAVLFGRPKAWEMFGAGKQKTPEEKLVYRQEQRETVIKTIREYNPRIPIIQNLDFGHTDPQFPVPSGGGIRIDSSTKKIFVTY